MRRYLKHLFLVTVVALACGGGGSSGNTECARNPTGQTCQTCLANARTGCVNNGVCTDQYNTWESCQVRAATEGCVDMNGNPATNCCMELRNTLQRCLDAMCTAWNAC